MDSQTNLRRFIETHNLKSDPFGRYRFNARVRVDTDTRHIEDQARVRISLASSENGTVHIEGSRKITSDWAHLDFNPEWQDYELDDLYGGLSITSSSDKMGEYTFTIIPV